MRKADLAYLLVVGLPRAGGGWLRSDLPFNQLMRWTKEELINERLDMVERAVGVQASA